MSINCNERIWPKDCIQNSNSDFTFVLRCFVCIKSQKRPSSTSALWMYFLFNLRPTIPCMTSTRWTSKRSLQLLLLKQLAAFWGRGWTARWAKVLNSSDQPRKVNFSKAWTEKKTRWYIIIGKKNNHYPQKNVLNGAFCGSRIFTYALKIWFLWSSQVDGQPEGYCFG